MLTSFLDALCELPATLRLGSWANEPSIRNALHAAKKRTGLSDPGPGGELDFVNRCSVSKKVGLQLSKAKYSPAGQVVYFEGCVGRMVDKLRFIDYLKKHPDIEKIQIKPPVFVIGFPRTGTTFLHELLGLHESVRMHYTWEQVSLVPNTDNESLESLEKDRKQRYQNKQFLFNFVFKQCVSERLQHIHRISYDEPEECTIPCAMELPWGLSDLALMVFAAQEILPLGAGKAYTQYRKALQLLTWQAPNRRNADFTWMLKCPFHLPYLNDLFDAFPQATIVWTHRDPAECIASACSLYETLMLMCFEETSVNKFFIGQAVLEYSKLSLQAALQAIDQLQQSNPNQMKIVHVRYADTIKDPKKLCKHVYAEVSYMKHIV
jgi:hypothetical protein